MTQENGMPKQPIAFCDGKQYEVQGINWREKFVSLKSGEDWRSSMINYRYLKICWPIGATSSDDPPQELYFGDLIELIYESTNIIGLIIWKSFSVMVKVEGGTSPIHWDMKWALETYQIKKLGSRYDPKMEEVLEKAGLEKS